MQRILNDASHPVTKAIVTNEPDENNNQAVSTTNTRVTRNKFEFDIALCKTERHMNTFVPKYTRVLEKSGFRTEAAKRRAEVEAKEKVAAAAAAVESAKAKKAAKAKVACSICSIHFTEGAGITNHERACSKKAKANAPIPNYNELPDFRLNYQFVTTRRPGQ